ncbi:MAG: acetyl-coenzyme A synthetase N-terminal domain-containing protein, partial [Thermoprotei archaeon]
MQNNWNQQSPEPIWRPTEAFASSSNMSKFMRWLNTRISPPVDDYGSLWQWSVAQPEKFWSMVAEYFSIGTEDSRASVLDTHRMPGCKWFPRMRVNYARFLAESENAEHGSVVSVNELGEKKALTHSQILSLASSVASFLRDSGVERGDRVAGFVSNTPETLAC